MNFPLVMPPQSRQWPLQILTLLLCMRPVVVLTRESLELLQQTVDVVGHDMELVEPDFSREQGHYKLYDMDSSLAGANCIQQKTLHLLRHAQGTHNAAEDNAYQTQAHVGNAWYTRLYEEHGRAWVLLEEVYGDKYWDPPLTPLGREQAARRHDELTRRDGFAIDVVVVSPFRRTLQTAYGALPQLQLAARAGGQRVPVVATDLLRERVGNYTCDARLNVSALQTEFPDVDFGQVPHDDLFFRTSKEDGVDGPARLARRTMDALEWMMKRPEKVLAVVSHQHFLRSLTGLFPNLRHAAKGFANAEERTVIACEERR
mmetsp:Transcript_1365/g.2581  ORF Transcript_1365/g.2581 Transcript_1365/m.2581 type:complete len:316 (-) Transcript_1365:254-1201(-)